MNDDELLTRLGPLAGLAGTWEGDKGVDRAPDPARAELATPYRERMVFEPMGPVDNHEQSLYGLRYATTAFRIGEQDAFHEELGYWLWDADAKHVMRCFLVPRGVTVLAGGEAEPDARSFSIGAQLGSATWGICSNPFLDREFRTERYDLHVTLGDDASLHYREDTQLRLPGRDALFHHTDENTLARTS